MLHTELTDKGALSVMSLSSKAVTELNVPGHDGTTSQTKGP
jgi:hypothetical protein